MAYLKSIRFWVGVLVCVLVLHQVVSYDANTIDVHLVCHSHTDAGWYNTYDGYYSSRVAPILNSVVDTLHSNSKYKFNWSDTSYLAKWYDEANDDMKQKLKDLIANGQFQFMGGGWVMNDESLTDYKNAIIQIQTGLDWILSTFGVRPKIGWQIDPFGNSPVTPSILSILGYEGIVLSRIGTTNDYDLEHSENSEFIWKGAQLDAEGDGNNILAHHLVRSKYQAPVEFKYQPDPFPFWVHPKERCSSISELENNYKKCIQFYYDNVLLPSLTGHRHNKVLSVFGDDFAYYNARYNFQYLDKFIEILNKHFKEVIGKDINIKYSTVNEYFDDIKSFNNGTIEFPVYKGDFLPYVELEDKNYDHWVGYYSSTPVLKHMIRDMFQNLRSLKIEILTASAKYSNVSQFETELLSIQRDASILMHHDAITSTSPWGTLSDYMARIRGINTRIHNIENSLLQHFTKNENNIINPSDKNTILQHSKLVTVFNPSGYERVELANFTIPTPYVKLYDSEGNFVQDSEVYLEYLAQYTSTSINPNVKDYVVIFEVKIPPFAMMKFYYVELDNNSTCNNQCVQIASINDVQSISKTAGMSNDFVQIVANPNEMISEFHDKVSGINITLPTSMYTYPGRSGNTLSGLYIFNPTQEATKAELQLTNRYFQTGRLVSLIHSFYKLNSINSSISQSIAINTCRNEALQRSIRVTTKINSVEYYEFTMRTNLTESFDATTTDIYVDNSAQSVKRQFFTYPQAVAANISHSNNETSYNGVNGYASIYGTAFKNQSGSFFGFANSNSILLNALKTNLYEIMLMRNTNYYDDKGITDPLRDTCIETFDQVMFISKSPEEFYYMKRAANSFLNDKLQVRKTNTYYESTTNTSTISLIDDVGITADFGDIDIIDARIKTENNVKLVNFLIRNKNPYELVLHSSFKFVGQGKTGKLINNSTEFKESITLPHPLITRREEYKDLRDILPENMEFKSFQKNNNEIMNAYDFLNVFIPLENFSKTYPKEVSIVKTFSSNKSKNEPLPNPSPAVGPSQPVSEASSSPQTSIPDSSKPVSEVPLSPPQSNSNPVSEPPSNSAQTESPTSSQPSLQPKTGTKFNTPFPGPVYDQPVKVENPLVQMPNPTDAHYISKPSPPSPPQTSSTQNLPVIENIDKATLPEQPKAKKDCAELYKTTWLFVKALSVVITLIFIALVICFFMIRKIKSGQVHRYVMY